MKAENENINTAMKGLYKELLGTGLVKARKGDALLKAGEMSHDDCGGMYHRIDLLHPSIPLWLCILGRVTPKGNKYEFQLMSNGDSPARENIVKVGSADMTQYVFTGKVGELLRKNRVYKSIGEAIKAARAVVEAKAVGISLEMVGRYMGERGHSLCTFSREEGLREFSWPEALSTMQSNPNFYKRKAQERLREDKDSPLREYYGLVVYACHLLSGGEETTESRTMEELAEL